MSGNSTGKLFRVPSIGESHGAAIGCVVDGCSPELPVSVAEVHAEVDLRKPGASRHVTQRHEPDEIKVLAGVFGGWSSGTQNSLLIRSQDQRSHEFSFCAKCGNRSGAQGLHG